MHLVVSPGIGLAGRLQKSSPGALTGSAQCCDSRGGECRIPEPANGSVDFMVSARAGQQIILVAFAVVMLYSGIS